MNVDSLTWLHGPKCFIFALHFRDANQPCAVSALRKWISDLTSSQSWRSWWCKKNKTRYSWIGRVIFLRSWLDWCEISVQVCCCCHPNIWVAMNVFVEGQWNDRSWWPNCPTLQEFAWSRGRVVPLVRPTAFTCELGHGSGIWWGPRSGAARPVLDLQIMKNINQITPWIRFWRKRVVSSPDQSTFAGYAQQLHWGSVFFFFRPAECWKKTCYNQEVLQVRLWGVFV